MNTKTISTRKPAGALHLAVCLVLAAGAVSLGQTVDAAEASGSMTVKATVASSCTVGTSNLDFGTPTSAAIQAGNVDATGSVSVNCTTGSPYKVALGTGAGTGATVAVRVMTSSAGTNPVTSVSTLTYSIYTDSSHGTVWGTADSATVAGTGSGVAQSIPAYGRIISPQTVRAGVYADTVAVTVTY
jgi:spore coat protein U-like protein